MKKRISILLALFIVGQLVVAQSAKLTLEDAVLARYSKFAPERLSGLGWIPGTDNLSVVEDSEVDTELKSWNVKSDKKEVIVNHSALNEAMKATGKEPTKRMPSVHFTAADKFWFQNGREYFRYDATAGKATFVNDYQEDAENVDLHEKTLAVAYTIDDNLYISLPGEADKQITKDGGKGITNGLAAHRFEFGISKGIFWSNTAQKVAFYRVDESMVTEYGMYNFSTRPAGTDMIRYPMAGQKSHHATMGVYDTKSGKTIFLDTQCDPEQYLTNLFWSPDDQQIFLAILNRDQNALELAKFDANTGKKLGTLFERKAETFVQPLHPGHFIPGNNNEFLWLSDKDGYLHLYKYNTDGKELAQLTKGEWMITDFHGFDESGAYAFISTTAESPLERHTYRVDLAKGGVEKLTSGKGNHTPNIQPSGKYVLDYYQSTEVPMKYQVIEAKKAKVINTLLDSKNPMGEIELGNCEFFTLKAEDGQDLYCRMITPPNFDKSKKYPVITYVYGGPGVQLLRDVWLGAAPLWMYYAAQEGYIVFTLENRGTANRGRKFEHTTFRNLGDVEVRDQLVGVEWLNSQPFVDASRMGIHGWSYGGFMTTSMMLKAPSAYKVGVAGGPVIDWAMYEIMYTERYMDTPQTNKEGYEKSSLLNYVDKLQGKLMLIHGTSDDVVLWQHSLEFIDKCIKSDVQVDYFVYPGHPHNVRGKDRLHLMQKVLDYIMDNL